MSAPAKERPILFSGSMVQALLAGRKTQTRRVVTPQPPSREAVRDRSGDGYDWLPPTPRIPHWRVAGPVWAVRDLMGREPHLVCPYGQPGDRLWVREEHYRFGHWDPVTTKRTRTGRQKWRFVADSEAVLFELPYGTGCRKGRHHKDPSTPAWHKRLARFMPRALSRITLEVTEVRVQRLQEISEEDARAEGVEASVDRADGHYTVTAREQFEVLWNSINGARPGCAWESNPWAWAVSFRVLEVRP